jgi:hypothetical protein
MSYIDGRVGWILRKHPEKRKGKKEEKKRTKTKIPKIHHLFSFAVQSKRQSFDTKNVLIIIVSALVDSIQEKNER